MEWNLCTDMNSVFSIFKRAMHSFVQVLYIFMIAYLMNTHKPPFSVLSMKMLKC